jgi:hypothetical protein
MSRPSKWSVIVALSAVVLTPAFVFADEVIQIRVGKNDREVSTRDLQRRVWELERAVSQLQRRIYQLEATPVPAPTPVVVEPAKRFTCSVSAFGKTYMRTAGSRGEAEGAVLKECSDASNEMHCRQIHCAE